MEQILIYGERGTGKSTLIARLLEELNMPVYGFVTKRLEAHADGFHPIYIHPAKEYFKAVKAYKSSVGDYGCEAKAAGPRGKKLSGLEYSDKTLVATCNGRIHEPNLEVFNGLGAEYILDGIQAQESGIIVMDEIGFLESEAEDFCNAILKALSGDRPVIASVKARPDIDFIRQILSTKNTIVYEVTEENREAVFDELKLKLSNTFTAL